MLIAALDKILGKWEMDYDVIVVGAGVEGSSTAYQLIKNGVRRVLLLEQVSKRVQNT